mgnify:CR=1 FL=1
MPLPKQRVLCRGRAKHGLAACTMCGNMVPICERYTVIPDNPVCDHDFQLACEDCAIEHGKWTREMIDAVERYDPDDAAA